MLPGCLGEESLESCGFEWFIQELHSRVMKRTTWSHKVIKIQNLGAEELGRGMAFNFAR